MSEVQHNSGRRLGRGLSALLGGGAPASTEVSGQDAGELRHINVNVITRNPFQPRKNFDAEALGELASSIKEHGVIQPIIVREFAGGYQLIAGERRWQAAQKAGLTTIACRVMDVIDKVACEFAIEENLKRQDLNDLEKAQAFRDYIDQFHCTVEELSKQLSMSRSAVANMLRLLDLTDPVKNALHSGRITAGHARALLPLDEAGQLELCGRIQAEKLNVRQAEAAVKAILKPVPEKVDVVEHVPVENHEHHEQHHHEHQNCDQHQQGEQHHQEHYEHQHHEHGEHNQHQHHEHHEQQNHENGEQHPEHNENPETLSIEAAQIERTAHIDSLESQLRDMLGVKVNIKLTGKECGTITIPFSSNSEFERVMQAVRRAA